MPHASPGFEKKGLQRGVSFDVSEEKEQDKGSFKSAEEDKEEDLIKRIEGNVEQRALTAIRAPSGVEQKLSKRQSSMVESANGPPGSARVEKASNS